MFKILKMELSEVQFGLKSYTWSEKQELESNGTTLIVPQKLPAKNSLPKSRSFRKRPLLIRFSLATTTAWLFGRSLTRGSTSIAALFQHQKRDKNTDSPIPHSANWENGFGKILSSSVQYRLHRGDGWSYNSNSLNEGQRQCHRILEYCITVLKKVTNR